MNATDGILFYFRNDREGQGACAAEVCPSVLPLANCSLPCLSGSCAEASLRNLPAEVNDFAVALPPSHPLYVGLYFTPYHSCDPPSVRYDEQAIAAALALPYVDGAVVYTLEFPRVSECAANSVDKGCVVRDIFGRWNRTSATRSLSPRCPSDFPFLAPLAAASSASESPPRMCCGTRRISLPAPRRRAAACRRTRMGQKAAALTLPCARARPIGRLNTATRSAAASAAAAMPACLRTAAGGASAASALGFEMAARGGHSALPSPASRLIPRDTRRRCECHPCHPLPPSLPAPAPTFVLRKAMLRGWLQWSARRPDDWTGHRTHSTSAWDPKGLAASTSSTRAAAGVRRWKSARLARARHWDRRQRTRPLSI